jgi:gluconokinase
MTDSDDRSSQGGSMIPLFIVGGPAGCGKTTIAHAIRDSTGFAFVEGDELHPPQNIAKMSTGHPLVDGDRWDWLDKIIVKAREIEEEKLPRGIIITCSALKKSYRDRLRQRVNEAREGGSRIREFFIYCNLSQEESMRRVQTRAGHYMKAGMVASQFADLQVPNPEEEERMFVLDVERTIPEVDQAAIDFVNGVMSKGECAMQEVQS